MKVFSYSVKDKKGKVSKGMIEAEAENKVIEHFHKEESIILSIKETKKKNKARARGKVKTDDLVIFSRQFDPP